MKNQTIAIVNYQAGNLFSVVTACRRAGYEPVITADRETITAADKVIIPGVGNSGIAMQSLREAKLDRLLPELRQPVLGICLGMQVLFSQLDESGDNGLGIIEGAVRRFETDSLPVPHMGWNRIIRLKGPLFRGIAEGEWFYFVHSYMAGTGSYTAAESNYGEPFTAAAFHNNFFGCQFHPEKSGEAGSRIIKNFLEL